MDDTDLVGVCDPDTGETGWMVVMGNAGTLFGLVVYRGSAGFQMYVDLMEDRIAPSEFLSLQDCLKLELGSDEDLEPEDRVVQRALGLRFKGKNSFPQFRSLMPRYAPWFLTESEARFFTLGLRAFCCHARRIERDRVDETVREDTVLVYRPSAKSADGFVGRWESYPADASRPLALVRFDDALVKKALEARPKPDSPWNAGIIVIPAPVAEGARPFFVRGAAVCQEVSGHAFTFHPGRPSDSDEQLLADALVRAVDQSGFLPDVVYVTSDTSAAALKALATKMGFAVRRKVPLPAIEQFANAITEEIAKGEFGESGRTAGKARPASERRGPKAERSERTTPHMLPADDPEVQAAMHQMKSRHWESWTDIPLPALNGKTPREAADDPRGRELLEALLLDFENQNATERDESLRVDVSDLRRRLGMERKKRR
jgi:hypothetical protein